MKSIVGGAVPARRERLPARTQPAYKPFQRRIQMSRAALFSKLKRFHYPRHAAPAAAMFALVILAGGRADGQVTLQDETVAVGLTAIHQADEVCICVQGWMTGGMAVGDFNNDGWQDIFWIGGGATSDKLFINDGYGAFTDETVEWGLDELHAGCGASVGDYNNDGFVDIYVTSFGDPEVCAPQLCAPFELDQVGMHRLYRNNGDGSFTNVAEQAGVNYSSQKIASGYGSAFGDYDLDGDLDLFVASWHHLADGNRLYRNDGDGTFTDVTDQALGSGMEDVWGFQPAFVDMDGDLYPELLLAADFETSCYLVNNRDGTFTNLTVASGTGLDDNGMGQTVADFNNDGLLDWYVTSVHQDNPEPTDNTGNMLYINLGDHLFAEVSHDAAVNDGGWGWGTVAVDLDHDGWVDIVEVNGRGGSAEWGTERAKLFYNLQDGTFEDLAESAGLAHDGQGRAVVAFDADNDGDQDLAISTNSGGLAYYENQTANIANWLRVRLDTSINPLLAPDGMGARIIVEAGGSSFHRHLNGNPSYLATSELAVHFGLGAASIVDELRVVWPRGYVTTLNNVAVNQHLTIDAPKLADLSADGQVDAVDLAMLLSAWGPAADPGALVADLNNDGQVDAADLAVLLMNWGET